MSLNFLRKVTAFTVKAINNMHDIIQIKIRNIWENNSKIFILHVHHSEVFTYMLGTFVRQSQSILTQLSVELTSYSFVIESLSSKFWALLNHKNKNHEHNVNINNL